MISHELYLVILGCPCSLPPVAVFASMYFSYKMFYNISRNGSRHFCTVVHSLAAFEKEMIKPPSLDETLRRYWRIWSTTVVQGCVAVINGTHIPAFVLTEKAVPHRSGQKNECTYGCLFSRRAFTWIWLGWKGSPNFVYLTKAKAQAKTNFLHWCRMQLYLHLFLPPTPNVYHCYEQNLLY